jgi:hypothetical protein
MANAVDPPDAEGFINSLGPGYAGQPRAYFHKSDNELSAFGGVLAKPILKGRRVSKVDRFCGHRLARN